MVLVENGFFLFTTRGSTTLKYINDVIDHTVETEICMQFMKRSFHSVQIAKSENNSKIVYWYIYINVMYMQTFYNVPSV